MKTSAKNNLDIALDNLSQQRQEALDKIEAIYYTPTSPHYRDNERFSWAVKSINTKFHQLRTDLIEKSSQPQEAKGAKTKK